ncbi:hypothetical protein GCM10025868_27920 [Angustibacter aerolatus]|uniref:AMP-dependent synthetase/ligase domain-containing protein n=1 Tax=Angustibacter aerolatus TaxID=1162965 RepID=A0ABQ6JL07_9ACTN|nr:hypothetical protein GCM10025868_27920 [Angustibacter aerolatus]
MTQHTSSSTDTIRRAASIADGVRAVVDRDPSRTLLRRRVPGGFEDVAAKAFADQVRALAKGFVAAGVGPGDRVGIMSKTRYEWTLVDVALWTAGAVPVPIYETSSVDQVGWILSDSQAVGVVVESAGHARRVQQARDGLPGLQHVWHVEDAGADDVDLAGLEASGHGVTDEQARRARRRAEPRQHRDPHLHVGDDGPAQGLRADPRQLPRGERQRDPPAARACSSATTRPRCSSCRWRTCSAGSSRWRCC